MARDAIKGSLLGQLLALLIAVTAVCSASLAGQVRPRKSPKRPVTAAACWRRKWGDRGWPPACRPAISPCPARTRCPQGLSAPTLQSSLNYLLLAAVYLTLHVRRRGWRLKCKWYAYALLALLDVEGNFCLVMAYRYTSLTRWAM